MEPPGLGLAAVQGWGFGGEPWEGVRGDTSDSFLGTLPQGTGPGGGNDWLWFLGRKGLSLLFLLTSHSLGVQ